MASEAIPQLSSTAGAKTPADADLHGDRDGIPEEDKLETDGSSVSRRVSSEVRDVGGRETRPDADRSDPGYNRDHSDDHSDHSDLCIHSNHDDNRNDVEAGLAPVPSVAPPPYSIYTHWEKRMIVLAVSLAAFFSPVTAQIYLPALNVLAVDFNITSTQVNLTMTTYMILQGITPMFVGGLADGAGRRPAYIVCFVIYIAANIGLALCHNYASLLVIRCIQSAGSSSTIALCQAVVADIVTSAERGQYIGFTVLPVVLAPTVGPILGGVLSQYLGWRSIFWFLAISSAVTFVFLLIFLPETCRNIVGDGSIRPHPMYRTFKQLFCDWKDKRAHRRRKAIRQHNVEQGIDADNGLERTTTRASSIRQPLAIKFPNPLRSLMMLFEKEIGILVGYNAIVFAGFYSISVALPSQFQKLYGYNDLVIGLMYIPMAAGSALTAFVMGPLMNWNYRRHARRLGLPVDKSRQTDLAQFPVERARLEIGVPLAALAAAVILCWGWVLEQRVSVAVPCVLNFFYGVGMVGFNNTVSVLLIDVTPGHAGAAVAANNLARCLLGALFSAVIVPMIDGMGIGWAFFFLGALYIVFLPLNLLLMRNGIRYRAEMKAREARRKEQRHQKKADKAARKGEKAEK
ncbi:major facilitator superfamily transporter [Ophiostoma piceae UAMH 11346]|uniref:Major facilitator superfamily transporter n=1 Tax=Ophiostoma piceae (strain UAMH 11346) TaxID=1262450 RepID=S3CBR9_OPHP1|nr:major facilitator superfamily transporter [Ophiostoma piceae UAMH 11346]